jgi:hypothetical protein
LALAALSLTGGEADAASESAAINVSITIEARCVVALADAPRRQSDSGLGPDFAVQCTDLMPYQVLFADGQSRQFLNPGVLPAIGANLLEIAF